MQIKCAKCSIVGNSQEATGNFTSTFSRGNFILLLNCPLIVLFSNFNVGGPIFLASLDQQAFL